MSIETAFASGFVDEMDKLATLRSTVKRKIKQNNPLRLRRKYHENVGKAREAFSRAARGRQAYDAVHSLPASHLAKEKNVPLSKAKSVKRRMSNRAARYTNRNLSRAERLRKLQGKVTHSILGIMSIA